MPAEKGKLQQGCSRQTSFSESLLLSYCKPYAIHIRWLGQAAQRFCCGDRTSVAKSGTDLSANAFDFPAKKIDRRHRNAYRELR
jgi:hypothetical protein